MKEIYHGWELEVIKEKSHIGWIALFWSIISTSTWEELDSGVEKDGSMKGLMGRLKERIDERRKE